MDDVFEHCDTATAGLAALDAASLDVVGLRSTVVRLQTFIDRIVVTQAKVLAEAEARDAFAGTGARGAADWLADRSKCSYAAAKQRTTLGAALAACAPLRDAVESGDVSPDTAAAVTGAVLNPPKGTDEADIATLIDCIRHADPREARKAAERWREIYADETPEDAADRRYQSRSFTTRPTGDGMVATTLLLPNLEARIVWNAANHASPFYEGDTRTGAQRLADGLVAVCDAYARGEVTGGREKPTIIVTISAESLTGESSEPGTTPQGDNIPAHVVRHLAENAELQRIIMVGSLILEMGRSVRLATESQYRALLARDGGCRWGDCGLPGSWCDIDHIVPWEDGGSTNLDNLWFLCRHHHVERHRPGVRVIGGPLDATIVLADGTIIDCSLKRRSTSAAA